MVKLIVEGDDDKKFFSLFLNHLVKDGELNKRDFDASIIHMGGKSKLLDATNSKYVKTLNLQIKSDKLKRVLFIFDCDFEQDDHNCNGMEKSQECFKSLIDSLKWDIEIDLYIFNRNLDYFLMETIKDKACYEDFKKLVHCLDIEKLKPNRKPIANLYRDLYPYPQFDFTDESFNELKQKLKNLFKEETI